MHSKKFQKAFLKFLITFFTYRQTITQKQKHPKKQTVDCWIGDLAKQKSPLSKDRKNKKVKRMHSVMRYTSKQDAPGKQ